LWIASEQNCPSPLDASQRRLRSKFEQFFSNSKQQVTQKNRVPRRNLPLLDTESFLVWISLSPFMAIKHRKKATDFVKFAAWRSA
jgi:hypothetical protein